MRISLCLAALALCVIPASAQQVYYHWVDADEVWVWPADAGARTLALRVDETGAVENPPQDSLSRAAVAALFPDDPGDRWNRLAMRLREAARQEQQAAAQGRRAYRGFAAPREPDIVLSVLDSLDRVYVDVRGRTVAHRLTFRRTAGQLQAASAGQSYAWLASVFGQQRADSLSMLRIARLFEPERAVPPNGASAWDALFGTWLETLPAAPAPRLYPADASGRGPWEWMWVTYRQGVRAPPPSTNATGRNAVAAFVVLGLLAAGIGLATWIDRRGGAGFPAKPTLPGEDTAGATERAAIPLQEIRTGLDAHLAHLEQAYGFYEDILPHLPPGDKATLQQLLDLAQEVQAWYDENARPASSAQAAQGDSWYPRATETAATWFHRLVHEELPGREARIAAQQRDVALLEKRVAEAVTLIDKTGHRLDRLGRGEALDDAKEGSPPRDPRGPIPTHLDDRVHAVGRAMADNQNRIKELADLESLAGVLHLGQRSFLDLHNDAQLDNALAGLIDYSLTQLALALAAGGRQAPRTQAMWANLYTITRNLQVFNQKTVHGFDLAFETLKKDTQAPFKEALPPAPEKHGPEAKLFLVRLKFLRDVARVNLQPFYYVDDQGEVRTIGQRAAS